MSLKFSMNGHPAGPYFVGFSPVSCTLSLTSPLPGVGTIPVTVSNLPATVGQVVFYSAVGAAATATIVVNVPRNGTAATFFIGGKAGVPSVNRDDAAIRCVAAGIPVLAVHMMVRVRKNANTITAGERDRFLSSMVRFLQSGQYQAFLDMHVANTSGEIHGRPSFLVWHRTYVLDLERHLQVLDPTVTIPYWKFEEPAPHVFTPDFLGVPGVGGVLTFSASNPLRNWRIPGLPQLARTPRFNTVTSGANVESESSTLGRGPGYTQFRVMEGNPHGNAHTSFSGPISSIPTAPQDPLFFMLHCNVDRLWATWQVLGAGNTRVDPASTTAYPFQTPPGTQRKGDNAGDTLWPWDGDNRPTRPSTAPGGPFISSPFTASPGPTPKVKDMIDYRGKVTRHSDYFDYDTVAF